MKLYELTLNHDAGTVKIRALAQTIHQAIERVCSAELAPARAVRSWRILPDRRQQARLKNRLCNV